MEMEIDMEMIAEVIFLQDHTAMEYLEQLEEQGVNSTIYALAQWDYGEYVNIYQKRPWGNADCVVYALDGYILTYNRSLGYIGLYYAVVRDRILDTLRSFRDDNQDRDPILDNLISLFVWSDYRSYYVIADYLEEMGEGELSYILRYSGAKIKEILNH